MKILVEFLGDLDLCCDAAEAIMRIDRLSGIALILPLLKNPDAGVHWWICGLLSSVNDGSATNSLSEVLLNDPESFVRLAAAFALGGTGDAVALPALAQAAQTDKGEDWEGRTVADAARKAIAKITLPPEPRWS
jgi:HEAT repeat protein